MNKNAKLLLTMGSVVVLGATSGCSSIVPDHGLDYQEAKANEHALQLPEGSEPVSDKLVIPNEDKVADLQVRDEFDAPRAPFLYQPLANIPLVFSNEAAELRLPVSADKAKSLFTAYFNTLATEDVSDIIDESSDLHLATMPLSFAEAGSLTKIWTAITRLEPVKYRFDVNFTEAASITVATIQVTAIDGDKQKLVNVSNIDDLAEKVVGAWAYIAQELNDKTVLLSDQGKPKLARSLLWLNQKGQLAYYLGEHFERSNLDQFLESVPGFYLTSDSSNKLAVVPEDKLARVGDIVDFTIPVNSGIDKEDVSLFKVRRRNLDNAKWDERSYSYELAQQQEGYFLTVDTSSTDDPLLTSYRILSRLAK